MLPIEINSFKLCIDSIPDGEVYLRFMSARLSPLMMRSASCSASRFAIMCWRICLASGLLGTGLEFLNCIGEDSVFFQESFDISRLVDGATMRFPLQDMSRGDSGDQRCFPIFMT